MQLITTPEEEIRSQGAKDGVTHYATGVVVVRGDKMLVVRRAAHDFLGGVYELPGGGVDDGETIEQAAIREIQEEIGLKVKQVVCMFEGFDYTTPKKPRVRQYNFIATVEEGLVMLDPNEHDDYKFITEDEIDSLNCTKEIKAALLFASSRITGVK